MAQLLLDLAAPPPPSLDNFVTGADGANAATLAVLRSFGTAASADRCIYLWGARGSGCTHLLTAWRRLREEAALPARQLPEGEPLEGQLLEGQLLETRPPERALTGSDAGSGTWFTQDDVESLDHAAQIDLFNRINAARDGRGYVLAAGRAAPAQLPLRDDLKSRLAWGLTSEITALSDADKRDALLRHAAARSMTLSSDVLAYLMTHVRRDMPTLAGILDGLDHFSLETKRPVTLPLVRELLAQNRTLDL